MTPNFKENIWIKRKGGCVPHNVIQRPEQRGLRPASRQVPRVWLMRTRRVRTVLSPAFRLSPWICWVLLPCILEKKFNFQKVENDSQVESEYISKILFLSTVKKQKTKMIRMTREHLRSWIGVSKWVTKGYKISLLGYTQSRLMSKVQTMVICGVILFAECYLHLFWAEI